MQCVIWKCSTSPYLDLKIYDLVKPNNRHLSRLSPGSAEDTRIMRPWDLVLFSSINVKISHSFWVCVCSSRDELLGPIKCRRGEANGFRFLMMSLWSSTIPHGLINPGKAVCVWERVWELLFAFLYPCVCYKVKNMYVSACVINAKGGQRPLIWWGPSSHSQLILTRAANQFTRLFYSKRNISRRSEDAEWSTGNGEEMKKKVGLGDERRAMLQQQTLSNMKIVW